MTYEPVPLSELPRELIFLQDIATTSLTEAELASRFGFVFENVADDLSACEVCAIKTSAGEHFLVVYRKEIREWTAAIRIAMSAEPIETYAPRMLAAFLDATKLDVERVDPLWPSVTDLPPNGLPPRNDLKNHE